MADDRISGVGVEIGKVEEMLLGSVPAGGYSLGVDAALEKAKALKGRRKYRQALNVVKPAIDRLEANNLYSLASRGDGDAGSGGWFRFRNPFEEALYRHTHAPKGEIRHIPEDVFGLYVVYGWLLFETRRFGEAEKVLETAMSINPVNCEPVFERAEIAKMRGDWDTFLSLTGLAFGIAYTGRDLVRCYRNRGFYEIERENHALATALFQHSLTIDSDSVMAR